MTQYATGGRIPLQPGPPKRLHLDDDECILVHRIDGTVRCIRPHHCHTPPPDWTRTLADLNSQPPPTGQP